MEHLPMSFLVAFLLLCLSLNLPGFCVAGGNDSFVFAGFAAGAENLTLDGTAAVTREGLLGLTNNEPGVKGHAFYRIPLQFKDSPNGTAQSFSLAFVFAILSASSDLSTDGMAFVIAPGKDFSNASPAQYLGLLDSHSTGPSGNPFFAVELDTIKNDEFQDIDDNHVGIDIDALSSVESSSAAFHDDKDGTLKNLSLISTDGELIQVWVDYDGEAKQINVTLAPMGVAKPSKPLLSNTTDLSAVITDHAYAGFSAATGPIKSRHCVLAWSFAMNGPAPPIDFKKMPKLPHSGHNHKTLMKVLEIALPAAAFVALLACIGVFVIVQRKLAYDELREDWEVEFGPHRFSYKELFMATEGFKSKHLLGAGGFGKVYKGVLPKSKLEVAVKRVSHDSSQGIKEFVSEVVSIGHLRHRNLVQLLGYCRRKGELLLVYDYMPSGSLDKYLYGEENKPLLEWPQRLQIIKDVASGLYYLHEKWEQVVIHRDIKASNVLLDGAMVAHLGDFGLARLYDHGTDLQTTHVVGTMGYIAPELSRTGKASPLTDVFAFGAFLLEVATGRRPVEDGGNSSRLVLVDWVFEHWRNGSLVEAVDPRIQGDCDVGELSLALRVGLLCSHPLASVRPGMRQVMQYLAGDAPLPELATTHHMGMSMLALLQNQGFDAFVMASSSSWSSSVSVRSFDTSLSRGR